MKKLAIFHLCTLIVVTIILAACGGTSSQQTSSMPTQAPTVSSDAPKGYLDSNASSVVFLQWTEKNGQLSGQLEEVYTDPQNALQTKNENEAFTGTHDGDNISISTSIFGVTKTDTGTLKGDVFTLVVPNADGTLATLTFHPASIEEYNTAATALLQSISQQAAQATATEQTQETSAYNAQATATVQADLDQAVTDANTAVTADFQHLDTDRGILKQEQDLSSSTTPYQDDLKTMQSDVNTEQSDAKNGCGNTGTNYAQVGSDEARVGSDTAKIGSDDAGFQSSSQHVSADTDATAQRVATTRSDWTMLQAAIQANGGFAGAPTLQQFTDEVNATQTQITATKNAIDSQTKTVAGYDAQAKQLDQHSKDVYNGMHC